MSNKGTSTLIIIFSSQTPGTGFCCLSSGIGCSDNKAVSICITSIVFRVYIGFQVNRSQCRFAEVITGLYAPYSIVIKVIRIFISEGIFRILELIIGSIQCKFARIIAKVCAPEFSIFYTIAFVFII